VSPLVFYPLAFVCVASAMGVVLSKNPVRSALSLVASLFCLAVFYAFLQAHLVAALQIIVYAGAVMVLFLFVITLLNLESDRGVGEKPGLSGIGFCAGTVIAACMVAVLSRSVLPGSRVEALEPAFGTTIELARQLFRDYLVAFELTSVLLLVAVVGAVVLAKRDGSYEGDEQDGQEASLVRSQEAPH